MNKNESKYLPNNRINILIVDDSPEAIDILLKALPEICKCQVALSGEKAIKLLNKSKELPDLILLDVMMPGLNGYEIGIKIKNDSRLNKIPVIYLSSLTDAKDKVKAFKSGAADYIEKPFQIEEVRARMETQLKLHFLQKGLEDYNIKLEKMVDDKVKEISESQMATIFALAKLAESRDDDTGAHLLRVSLFCQILAEELAKQPEYKEEMSDAFINYIVLACPLHDIGKVGIRDSILLKPGKLLHDEFDEMKTHTIIGAKTLAEVYKNYPHNNFIKTGMEMAMSHHEKWNGSGYTEGLKGHSIPISARIMAMADVYDALRTKRVYKEAYSHEKTFEIIMEEAEEHFDPLIVKAFVEKQEEFRRVYDQLVEG